MQIAEGSGCSNWAYVILSAPGSRTLYWTAFMTYAKSKYVNICVVGSLLEELFVYRRYGRKNKITLMDKLISIIPLGRVSLWLDTQAEGKHWTAVVNVSRDLG